MDRRRAGRHNSSVLPGAWRVAGPERAPRVTDPADDLDAFLEACGGPPGGSLTLDLKGPRRTLFGRRAFRQPFVVIGRAPGVDLALDHPAVSRRHTYLQLVDGRLFAVDLVSRTGTFWPDGARPMGWLPPGAALRVGPCRIGAADPALAEAPGHPPSPTARPADPPADAPTLHFLDPAADPPSWRLEPVLTLLGRSPACKVQLAGPDVSRLHASLVRTPAGVWAVDLLGRGGILVNDAPARAARLRPGDVLQLGPHRIRLSDRPAPEARPAPLPATIEPATLLMPRPYNPSPLPGSRDPSAPDALLVPLVRELGQLQTQMADQFHQALAMMFQMFHGMHREQMDLIREELAAIRRLAEEQRSLQAELAARRAAPANGPAPPRRPPPLERPPRRPDPARPEPAPAAHDDLVRRLDLLQQEQHGRWQKILRSVLGES